MTTATAKSGKNDHGLATLIISTFLITAFLFFIDEGYYNFNWVTGIGHWIVFSVYATAIFLGQLLISRIFLKNYKGTSKTPLSILGGAAIGVLFVVFVIFTN